MNLVSHEKLEVVFSAETSELANYKLEIEIPAPFSKERRRKTMAVMKKNAAFRGFRKGTIPPFIMKDIPGFVLQDSIEELLKGAFAELGLEPTEGEAAEPKMDIDEMMARFKVGEDFIFTCELPLRKVINLDATSEEDIIDVIAPPDSVKGAATSETLQEIDAVETEAQSS